MEILEAFLDLNKITNFTDKEGVTWYNGYDVCNLLGYKSSRVTIPQHVGESDRFRDDYNAYWINEFGLCEILIKSRKPLSNQFIKWLSHVYLPKKNLSQPDITRIEKFQENVLTLPTSQPTMIDLIFSKGANHIIKQLEKRHVKIPFRAKSQIKKFIEDHPFSSSQERYDFLIELTERREFFTMPGSNNKLKALLLKFY